MKKNRRFETLLMSAALFNMRSLSDAEPIVLEAPPREPPLDLPFHIAYPEDPRGCRGSSFIPSKLSKKWSRRG